MSRSKPIGDADVDELAKALIACYKKNTYKGVCDGAPESKNQQSKPAFSHLGYGSPHLMPSRAKAFSCAVSSAEKTQTGSYLYMAKSYMGSASTCQSSPHVFPAEPPILHTLLLNEPEADDEDINSLLPISLDGMLDASFEANEEDEEDIFMSTTSPSRTHSRPCLV